MSDDLAKRLRARAAAEAGEGPFQSAVPNYMLHREAADEIERLRELFRVDGNQHATRIREMGKAHDARIAKYYEALEAERAKLREAVEVMRRIERETIIRRSEVAEQTVRDLRTIVRDFLATVEAPDAGA